MKKFLFLVAIATMFVSMFSSCGGNTSVNKPTEEKFEKAIFTTAKTEVVDIEFKSGESPYFGISMRTGSEKDNIVWVSFYRANDVDKTGHVRQGAVPCRYYQIILPYGEIAKKWGVASIVTRRENGTEHTILLNLVNQPD